MIFAIEAGENALIKWGNKMPELMQETKKIVKERYSKAAKEKEESLCCPTGYKACDTSHIPKEVIDKSYGCGNPIAFSSLRPGETVLDLGSGLGIDCFIAAKKVGSNGKVIGIDMTEEMLQKANKNRSLVSESLGYDNMEFKNGYLEKLPVEDNSVDTVLSNCVINLSMDKNKVFNEMHRVMKDGAIFIISDIVSDKEVPEHMRKNKELWSGCISGAETIQNYLNIIENSGFFGMQILKKYIWKEIEGIKFISVVVKGHKLSRSKECVYVGHTATYVGPMKKAEDDEGHIFLRGIPQEVCTETAKRLKKPPYDKLFIITDSTKSIEEGASCTPKLKEWE